MYKRFISNQLVLYQAKGDGTLRRISTLCFMADTLLPYLQIMAAK